MEIVLGNGLYFQNLLSYIIVSTKTQENEQLNYVGFMTHQPLWVNLCHLPERGRKEIEIAEEMKERDREERGK